MQSRKGNSETQAILGSGLETQAILGSGLETQPILGSGLDTERKQTKQKSQHKKIK